MVVRLGIADDVVMEIFPVGGVVRASEKVVGPFAMFIKCLRDELIEGWFVDAVIRIGIELEIVFDGGRLSRHTTIIVSSMVCDEQ